MSCKADKTKQKSYNIIYVEILDKSLLVAISGNALDIVIGSQYLSEQKNIKYEIVYNLRW